MPFHMPSLKFAALLLLVAGSGAVAQSDWKPAAVGRTLADDLKTTEVKLVEGYAKQHPRLLFSAADKDVLAAKAKAEPELWKRVLDSSGRLRGVPDAQM